MGVRHRGRKALLQIRFAMELNGKSLAQNIESMDDLMFEKGGGIGTPLDSAELSWITELGTVLCENRPEIDGRIESALENWTLGRLSLVTRLVIEQAVAEMLYADPPVPAPVAIDEAVELAREFDSEESAAFVNGVLDRIHRPSHSL